MFGAEYKIPWVLQHTNSKAGFREKEKLDQGQTKYMFLTLQWRKSVSYKANRKIWYVKSCILFRMLSSIFFSFFPSSSEQLRNKVTGKVLFSAISVSFMLLQCSCFSVYLLAFLVYVDHTHTHILHFSLLWTSYLLLFHLFIERYT